MLCVSRKHNEVIWIGKNIRIVIVDIDRGKVRVGIDCPRDIPIFREELLERPNVKKAFERAPLVAVATTGAA